MVIKCTDECKMCAVLEKLQAETDIMWYGGDKINEYEVNPMSYPVWLCIDEETRQMTWADAEALTKRYGEEIEDIECLKIDMTLSEPQSDPVNHPSHYTQGKVECIDAMEQVFGVEAVKHYCLGAAFKYLWRRKLKENEEQDIQKSLWYFDKFKELTNR